MTDMEELDKNLSEYVNNGIISQRLKLTLMEIALVNKPLNPLWRVTHINGEPV